MRYDPVPKSRCTADLFQGFEAYCNRGPSNEEGECHVIHNMFYPDYFCAFYHEGDSKFLWGAFGDKRAPEQTLKVELRLCTAIKAGLMSVCSNLTDLASVELLCYDINTLREKITLQAEHRNAAQGSHEVTSNSPTSPTSTDNSSQTDLSSETTITSGSSCVCAQLATRDIVSLLQAVQDDPQKIEALRDILDQWNQKLGNMNVRQAGHVPQSPTKTTDEEKSIHGLSQTARSPLDSATSEGEEARAEKSMKCNLMELKENGRILSDPEPTRSSSDIRICQETPCCAEDSNSRRQITSEEWDMVQEFRKPYTGFFLKLL